MIKQITIDENNVVTGASVGGIIPGGIDVEEIPEEVMSCPGRWTYKDGVFAENPDYVPPAELEEITNDDLAMAVAELAETTAADKLEIEMAIAELAEVVLNG